MSCSRLGGTSSMRCERKDFWARLAVHHFGFAAMFACALLAVGCKVDNVPEGALIVALESDLSLPKDIDRVRLEWSQDGQVLHKEEQELGEGHMLLPSEFRVAYPGNDRPVLIRAVAWSGADVRIERSAVTPVPHTFVGLVRLPLSFLCTGQVTADGQSSCGQDQTCRQGECSAATLRADEITRYGDNASRSSAVRAAADGGGLGAPDASMLSSSVGPGCFDVASCFSALYDVDVELESCAFTLPFELPLERLNIALRQPLGRDGICDNGSCFVVLDSDPQPTAADSVPFEGYRMTEGRVRLPPGVCKRIRKGEPLQVTMSFICNAKTIDNPPCGAWSSVQSPLTQPEKTSDSGQGIAVGVPGSFLGQACAGPARQACGMCGTQGRDCNDGTWSSWASCMAEGACEPGQVSACERGGTSTCGGDCAWGPCLGQTCEGPTSRACGNCGTQMRRCDNGVWSEWSECSGPGMCPPNAERSCGSDGTQACGGNCQWGSCTNQVCPGAASEACGNCGTRTRSCDANTGKWSEFGPCSDEGACAPDSTRVCGRSGMQSCRGDCAWDDACTGQMCQGESTRACGNCGTQTRTCNTDNGTWSDWSTCRGQGECSANATRACGSGGTQVCGGNCRWDDACTGQSCSGTALQSCGNCGVQTRSCDSSSGRWSAFSSCMNQGSCSPGDTRSCGSGGTQTCGSDCRWSSQCSDQSCTGSASEACGNCGTRTRTCNSNTGTWSSFGPCSDEGECKPDATRDCGRGGSQSCGRDCRWQTACTGQSCSGDSMRSCDRCGHESRTCNPNTGMFNGWSDCTGQGECNPGDAVSCGTGGMRKCNPDCRYDTACTGQMCPLPAPTQSCGNCGTQTAICDASTGKWTTRWNECTGQGECREGDTEGCQNGGSFTCTRECRFDRTRCLNQKCDGLKPADKTCGKCGHAAASCDGSTGNWTFGPCLDEGECSPKDTMMCGGDGGMRVCGNDCRWPAACGCKGPQPADKACGSCGHAVASCDPVSGAWTYGACQGEGECMPEQTMTCTGGGSRTCGTDCHWGAACSCKGPQPADTPCGKCGHAVATCDPQDGAWKPGACQDQGECSPKETMMCGDGGTRVCGNDCHFSKDCACPQPQPAAAACERCGTQPFTCSNGKWVPGVCQGQQECEAGAKDTVACDGVGERTCDKTCRWGECVSQCPGKQTPCGEACVDTSTDRSNCGACGTKCTADEICKSGCKACGADQHVCSNACVPNTSRDTCGDRCEPCPGEQECLNGRCQNPPPVGGTGGSGGPPETGGSGGTRGGASGETGGPAGSRGLPAAGGGANSGGGGAAGSVPPLILL